MRLCIDVTLIILWDVKDPDTGGVDEVIAEKKISMPITPFTGLILQLKTASGKWYEATVSTVCFWEGSRLDVYLASDVIHDAGEVKDLIQNGWREHENPRRL